MDLNSILLDNGLRIVMKDYPHCTMYMIGKGGATQVWRKGEIIDEYRTVTSNGIRTTPKELFAHPVNHKKK